MPELPEVETIRRGLQPLVGRRIRSVAASDARLRKPSPLPLAEMAGARIEALRRHGKVLFIDLSGAKTLVVHLGMTGKLLFAQTGDAEQPHTHVRILLDGPGPEELRFIDARRFGWVALHGADEPPQDVAHYGPDALDPALDGAWMADAMAASRAPLKSFLLDQTKVAGIGNIYACEALWRARLSPRRRACDVPRKRAAELLGHVRDVLNESIAEGGTSFNDYVDAIGRPGTFMLRTAVFRREGSACPRCGALVQRIVQSGRSTFWCSCQR